MSQMISGREYDNNAKTTAIFQCALGGGTAVLSIKLKGSPAATSFTDIKTWSADEVVQVTLPPCTYKVTLTGAAEVTSS